MKSSNFTSFTTVSLAGNARPTRFSGASSDASEAGRKLAFLPRGTIGSIGKSGCGCGRKRHLLHQVARDRVGNGPEPVIPKVMVVKTY